MILIDLITIFCLSYIIPTSTFPLIRTIKKWIGLDENRTLISSNKILDTMIGFIHKILNCEVCLSFWMMLAFTFNIKYAIIAYVSMTLLTNLIEYLKNNIYYE